MCQKAQHFIIFFFKGEKKFLFSVKHFLRKNLHAKFNLCVHNVVLDTEKLN